MVPRVPQGASLCLRQKYRCGRAEKYAAGLRNTSLVRVLARRCDAWGHGEQGFCSFVQCSTFNFFLDSASVGIRCTTALYAGTFLSPHWQDQFTSTVLYTVVIGLNKIVYAPCADRLRARKSLIAIHTVSASRDLVPDSGLGTLAVSHPAWTLKLMPPVSASASTQPASQAA